MSNAPSTKHFFPALFCACLFLLLSTPRADATPIYWNVFNIEGENSIAPDFVTYGSLMDMLLDQNRTGVFHPDGPGSSENHIIGTGAFVMGPGPIPVPEPSSLTLLGSALGLAFGASMRGRRQRGRVECESKIHRRWHSFNR